jgi:hypothetical protein
MYPQTGGAQEEAACALESRDPNDSTDAGGEPLNPARRSSASTLYKSGGFDSGGGNTALGQARIVQPETTDNYELGARTVLLDRRLTLNATLYRMKVEDLQFRTFDGFSFRVRNNGTIRQQGVEFDVVGIHRGGRVTVRNRVAVARTGPAAAGRCQLQQRNQSGRGRRQQS